MDDIDAVTSFQSAAYDYTNISYSVDDLTLVTTGPDLSSRERRTIGDIILITLYIVVFVLAVIGNALVIVTLIRNRSMRSVINIFLFSLSVSDLYYASVSMPVDLVGYQLRNFIFGPIVCKLISYAEVVSVAVSVWTLVAVAFERYHAICYPLTCRAYQTKARAVKIVALIWISACIIGLPVLIYTRLKLYDTTRNKYGCEVEWNKGMRYSSQIFLLVSLMILPLVCFIFVYGKILLKFRQEASLKKRTTVKEKEEKGAPGKHLQVSATAERESEANDQRLKTNIKTMPQSEVVNTSKVAPVHNRSNKASKKVVRMSIVLVTLFVIAWTPTHVYLVSTLISPWTVQRILRKIPNLPLMMRIMGYCSTCVNPIVYCFMSTSFRKGLIEVFNCCARQ